MSDMAISVEGISKQYVLGESGSIFDKMGWLRRVRGRPAAATRDAFWALDDVNFKIAQGEAVGIIGHNGAGKSTLLKVLSRITEPTRGRAVIAGRVASLLEVGTGFHPELTGRENIFMNGSILGMRRAEIVRVLDEIIAFAEIEKFIDTPVKRYSSGMYIRLAFAVAAHLEPEILIVDEVLAVGDIQFQKKCLGKMGDVGRSGRTVLFVSHNMTAIRQLTTRCILLKRGSVFYDGEPNRAIDIYSEATGDLFLQGADLTHWPRPPLNLTRDVNFKALRFAAGSSVFESDDEVEAEIEVTVEAGEDIGPLTVNGTVFEAEGLPVGSFFSEAGRAVQAGQRQTFRLRMQGMKLAPGKYSFCLGLVEGNEKIGYRDHDVVRDVLPFEVGGIKGEAGTAGIWYRNWGPVRFDPPRILAV